MISVSVLVKETPVPAIRPLTAIAGPTPSFTSEFDGPVPALDKVTELAVAVLVIVMSVPVDDNEIPVPAVNPLVASVGPTPSLTRDSVPPAEVRDASIILAGTTDAPVTCPNVSNVKNTS